MCQEHTFSYHSVPGRLIDLVGGTTFGEWVRDYSDDTDEFGRPGENFSIVDFVEHFEVSKEDFIEATRSWMTDEAMGRLGVTREEYQEAYGYTDEQIDAIYSGDQSQINEAFCGELAYYNPSDSQLYSIYWLSDHTYEDYREADLPTIEIDKILTKAGEMGGIYAQLAEAAWLEQREYVGVTETGPVYDTCMEHVFSFHAVPYELILWIGTDAFYDWEETLSYEMDEFGRPDEDFTIVEVVEQFNVPKETFWEITRGWMTDEAMDNMGMTQDEYIAQCGYSDEQIDAIYSGDQSQINEAFCGDLAYYNPSDGQLYSIYWLSDHTYEDYREADLPTIEIDKILTKAGEMGGIYAQLAEAAWLEQREYVGVTETSTGGDNLCLEHFVLYHAIDYELIVYVGEDNFKAWQDGLDVTDEYGRYYEEQTIDAFVNHFGISRETLVSMCDYYSEDQLDAIYSGDQSQINEAFCGDLAYYNPSDGQLYSIYWLSDHTAADYQAAGVPVSEVERILEDASAMGGSYASLAEAAAPAAEAYALK